MSFEYNYEGTMMAGDITIISEPSWPVVYIDAIPLKSETWELMRTPVKVSLHEGDRDIGLSMVGYCDDFDHIYIYPKVDIIYNRRLVLCP